MSEDEYTKSHSEEEFHLFKELFDSYYHQLLMYAFQLVNDKPAGEDIVQETFLALWVNRNKVDFSTSLKPYLYRAVHNRAINYLQSKYTNLEPLGKEGSMLLHKDIIQYNQQESLLVNELRHEVNKFIRTLPPKCKQVYLLSRKSELKNKEIARLLSISEKTVETHIGKALKELREHLIRIGLLFL